MREPMDALSLNNGINKVVLMKPTQIGGTEIGNNWIGATIAHYPVPMMMVLPTVELAKARIQATRKPDDRIDTRFERPGS